MCKGSYLVSHFYWIREIKTCLIDFEDVKAFQKIVEESTVDEE